MSMGMCSGVAGMIGFYDGFFGPGTGSFLAISFIALMGLGLTRATACAKVLNLTSNLVAAVVLATSGEILWTVGLAMARSEEHTSELQSLMRLSYSVFCFKKKIYHL